MTGRFESASVTWTWIGLAIAIASLPIVVVTFAALGVPRTAPNVLLREILILALAGCLLVVIHNREKLGWDSVGLGRHSPGNTALWVLITLVGVVLAMAVSFGLIHLFGWKFGGDSSAPLPLWLMTLVVVRAGFVEELFYRGYAIERLEALTGSRAIAAVVPLLVFATFHLRQGRGGVLLALLIGAVVTAVYLYKRNLWVNIAAHFLVDFVPNILIPLVAPDG